MIAAADPDDGPLWDDAGVPLYCIDGRRHPCPIHWPDEAAAQPAQLELDL